jgi:hypothetical protein
MHPKIITLRHTICIKQYSRLWKAADNGECG